LTLVVGAVLLLGPWLTRLWTAASAVQADLQALEALVEAGGAQALTSEQAGPLLRATHRDLETLREVAGPLLWLSPHLGWLPQYGPDLQAAPALLDIAIELTAAGADTLEALAPLLHHSGATEPPLLSQTTAVLAVAHPRLFVARSAVERARQAREGLPNRPLSPRPQAWLEQLDRYLPVLERGLDGLLILPELLGSTGPRTYLLLVQNEDELRATGGFISGVAELTVADGHVLTLRFVDSYAVDDLSQPYPDPPAALREVMLADLWLFRDSNWSPDFPTTARAAIELYAIGQGVRADGVIALDQHAIRLLVAALEPLAVAGATEPVTGDNVIRLARQAWQPDEKLSAEWWTQRKAFMAAVLDAVARRLAQEPARADGLRLGQAMLQALEQKHVLLYLSEPATAVWAAAAGWDGRLLTSSGDYLMVVDSNVGFNKVNALVEESLEYAVDLTDPDRPRAILTVRHRHTLAQGESPCRQEPRYEDTYEKMMARCYWDYLRVYAPAGAQLLAATPHPIAGPELLSGAERPGWPTVERSELGHTVFATLLLLRPGEALETHFEYALPPTALSDVGDARAYTLAIQKQPGTNAIPVHVRILLPPGAAVITSDPPPSSLHTTSVEYSLLLERDRSLKVSWTTPE